MVGEIRSKDAALAFEPLVICFVVSRIQSEYSPALISSVCRSMKSKK